MVELVANFRKRGTGDLVIDYEHASEFPQLAAGGAIPASGWLKEIDSAPDGDGVLWGRAEFTEQAARMIEAKEYKYLSPVIAWSTRDKETGEAQGATLMSMALTNRPFLEKLPAIQLSDGWTTDETGVQMAKETVFEDLDKLNGFIHSETVRMSTEKGMSYGQALSVFARSNPALFKLREALQWRRACPVAPNHPQGTVTREAAVIQLFEVEKQISGLVRAAMDDRSAPGYASALRMVASDHSELFRTRQQLMRHLAK